MRLFKHKKGRYENLYTEDVPNTGDNEVHEHIILDGKEGFLKTDIIHKRLSRSVPVDSKT